jgi:hypothetical protein
MLVTAVDGVPGFVSISSMETLERGISPLVSLTHSCIHVLNTLSRVYPIFNVTFPCFTSPGILTGAMLWALPCLNSITSTDASTPLTSVNAAVPLTESTVTRKFIFVNGYARPEPLS